MTPLAPSLDPLTIADPWLSLAASTALSVSLVACLALGVCRCLAGRPAPLRHAVLLTAILVAVAAAPLHAVVRSCGWGWTTMPGMTSQQSMAAADAPRHAATDEHGLAPHGSLPAPDATVMTQARREARSQTLTTMSPRTVGMTLCWLWLAGIAAGLLFLARDVIRLRRFLAALRPCDDPEAIRCLAHAARAVGLARPPRLCESASAAMPLVACGTSPVIVLPAGFARRTDAERLFAVLAHESAHVVRGDLWTGLLQRAAAIGFWWCPAIAAVNRRLCDVREEICDSHVARAQGRGLPLAETLLELARGLQDSRRPLAFGMLGTIGGRDGLAGRVARLLEPRPGDTHLGRRARIAVVGFLVAATTIVTATTVTAGLKPAIVMSAVSERELAAIDSALVWIAGRQQDDGSWVFDQAQPHRHRDAATALAVLTLLGRGYTHRHGLYQQQLDKGLGYLCARVSEDGGRDVATRGTMYSAGLVSLALCRAYGLSKDAALAKPAQATIDFIVDAQDPAGGGWRYAPRQPGDTSAFGWQVAALAAAAAAGLEVPAATITGAGRFLDGVQGDEDGTTYGYATRGSTTSCSAIGLVARTRTGWPTHDPRLGRGADAITNLQPSTNLYTEFHVSQLMHILGGPRNEAWRKALVPSLLEAQAQQGEDRGSWFDGFEKTAAANPFYCTVLATLILETPLQPRTQEPL